MIKDDRELADCSLPADIVDTSIRSMIIQFDNPHLFSEVLRVFDECGYLAEGFHITPLTARIWNDDLRPIGIRGRVLEWLITHFFKE